jgi:hypothetical protein
MSHNKKREDDTNKTASAGVLLSSVVLVSRFDFCVVKGKESVMKEKRGIPGTYFKVLRYINLTSQITAK